LDGDGGFECLSHHWELIPEVPYYCCLRFSKAAIYVVDGGFESLSHHWELIPEVPYYCCLRFSKAAIYEGNRKADGGFKNLSHHLVLLPEVLEGSNKKTLEKQMVASRASATILYCCLRHSKATIYKNN
jgi:hypothetical protein